MSLLVGPNVTDSTFDYDVSRSGHYQIIVTIVLGEANSCDIDKS